MVKDSIINDAHNDVFNNDASEYYNDNNDNNNVNNSESSEHYILYNNNDIVTNDADNEDNINGVTTNLSCLFEKKIENNNVSSDFIEKCNDNIDENMIESCDRSSDDLN
jgi:hypothetical protein